MYCIRHYNIILVNTALYYIAYKRIKPALGSCS